MKSIRLIHDTRELQGTCYFEFLPRKYQGKCWNAESVFLAEEVFRYIGRIIHRHEKKFDHYSFLAIHKATWERIVEDFALLEKKLAVAATTADLEADVGLSLAQGDSTSREFLQKTSELAAVLRELTEWLQEELKSNEYISVLGI